MYRITCPSRAARAGVVPLVAGMAGRVMYRRIGCYPVHRGSPELLAPRVVAAAVDEPGPVCVEGGDYGGLAAGAAPAARDPGLAVEAVQLQRTLGGFRAHDAERTQPAGVGIVQFAGHAW
jgi:hypothetical protein